VLPALTPFRWLTFSVTARESSLINLECVRNLAHFLWQLQAQGINLGPHLRLIAIHRDDTESYLSPATLSLNNPVPTVRQLLGMGTTRGYYDTNLEARKSFGLLSRCSFADFFSGSAGRCWQPDLLG